MNLQKPTEMWNERYGAEAFAYGELPNEFLKAELTRIPENSSILFPADGEGRNSVYAATMGYKCTSFDLSEEGKKKALLLADKQGVQINYTIIDAEEIEFNKDSFGGLVLIYAHFPADKKSNFHKKFSSYLKPGGIVILEGFSKNNLEYVAKNEKIGGPRNIDMLLSCEEIEQDFEGFETLYLAEEEIELHEGLYHNGVGSVMRYVGRKK